MSDGKTLYLVRHAEAFWMKAGQRDFDRPLNDRGKHDAAEMGQKLKATGIQPEIIISSPALRATQTAEIIVRKLGLSTDSILFNENIYEAETADLLKIVKSVKECHASTMLIGHNPSMTWLINHLTGQHVANAPTCS
ncbi:MAG: histidine phosphatase family protein, partial [Verrucomicrobiota bacterium]